MANKVYCVTEGMISRLHQGQVFKNFGVLSQALNILDDSGNPLSGNSKKAFLGELNRYVVLRREGRQYIVDRIRPEDEILPEQSTGGNKKYIEHIQRLLVHYFNSMCEQTGCDSLVILWEKVDIWQTLGMVNDNYRWYGYPEDERADIRIAEAFRKLAGGVKLKKWLDSALYGLYGRDALTMKEERAFIRDVGNNQKQMTILTDEQNAIYTRIKSELLGEYYLSDCETQVTEADLWKTGRMRDFFKMLNARLEKAFPDVQYDRIQKVYKIIIEPTSMKLFMRRFGKIDPADTKTVAMLMLKLNDLVCDGLLSAAALDNEVTVALRIQDHDKIQERIKEQSQWGGLNKMKLSEERSKRREFKYDPVTLNEGQKKFLIEKMVRLDEDSLPEKLKDNDPVENWHCQIVKKFNARSLLRESGLTEEQCDQLMKEAKADEAKEIADLMAKYMANAKEHVSV